MEPVTLANLLDAVHGQATGGLNLAQRFTRIETDSRHVRPGDLFWALRGTVHDGHDFVSEAATRGALGCVVEHNRISRPQGELVKVANTTAALADFAKWYRSQFEPLVVCVTGSVGKSTTRRMVGSVLSARFQGTESPQNFNNQIGVPLSVFSVDSTHEFAVWELGASHAGEIANLAAITRPEVGIITAIAPAHLDGFGAIEQISRTKGELIEALPATGFAVLNGDDERVRRLAARARCPVVFVGERPNNTVVAKKVEHQNARLAFSVGRSRFEVQAVGRHHLTAALIAVAVGREVDMTDDEIAGGLESFTCLPGRCQLKQIGDWQIIDDSYNANPASMAAACDLLASWKGATQRILVIGDMLSLGSAGETFHRLLGQRLAELPFDGIAALGPLAEVAIATAIEHGVEAGRLAACPDLNTLTMNLDCWLERGAVVLVKGSRGMRMDAVVQALADLAHQQNMPALRAAA